MDDKLLILPLEASDGADREPAATSTVDGSGWWPVIAVVALLVAVFALIRDDGKQRVAEPPRIAEPATTAPATTTVPPATVPVVTQSQGPAFDPPLLGRVWNSELVLVDGDVVTFVDLATGEARRSDLSADVRPPVAFYDDSIVFSNGRDLIRLIPGFANPRFVRADAREVTPLPGLPVAFLDHDSPGRTEVVVVGDNMGSTTWLGDDARPLAMWNGRILVSVGSRIELVSLDGAEAEVVAEGEVLSASADAVLYRSCPEPTGPCDVLLMRRDGTVNRSVAIPEDALAVSLGPHGNHVIHIAEIESGSGTAVVFVSTTAETAEPVSVDLLDLDATLDWPEPMWSHDGTAAVVTTSTGPVLVDVESGGALPMDQVVGDVEGDIVGFVSIRHEAGITSPAGTALGTESNQAGPPIDDTTSSEATTPEP